MDKEKKEVEIEIKDKKSSELPEEQTPIEEEVKEIEETFESKYLKSIAEMQNLRKRFDQERLDFYKYKSSSLIQEIIPTIDMFEMALGAKDISDEIKNWLIGFEMILKNIKNSLESEGVNEIKTKIGDEFNGEIHLAIDEIETNDMPNGHIVEIKSKGYKIHDRLLRPATVIVAKNIKKEKGE